LDWRNDHPIQVALFSGNEEDRGPRVIGSGERTLWIGRIPKGKNEDDVKKVFENMEEIESIKIFKFCPLAQVTFKTLEDCIKAHQSCYLSQLMTYNNFNLQRYQVTYKLSSQVPIYLNPIL